MKEMYLNTSSQIRTNYKQYSIINTMSRRTNSLRNSLVHEVQRELDGKYPGFGPLDRIMKNHPENKCYRSLPAQVSQQCIKEFHESYQAFFELLKLKQAGRYDEAVNTPGFKKSGGFHTIIFALQSFRIRNNQFALSIPKDLKEKYNTDFLYIGIPRNIDPVSVNRITINPTTGGFKVNFQYKVEHKTEPDTPIKTWLSIDLGVNNLCTTASNVVKPVIFSGRKIKSINSYFNKEIAKEQSRLKKLNNQNSSRRLNYLWTKRSNTINAELHKISGTVVQLAARTGIQCIIIGHNKGWKNKINLGKRNNQKFVQIPHSRLIHLITYKAQLQGIQVQITEESYTSKCSYFDQEEPKKQPTYNGIRLTRGLFLNSSGQKINADVNAALNISRKVLHLNVFHHAATLPVDIGLVMNPVMFRLNCCTSSSTVNNLIDNLRTNCVKEFS